MFVVILLDRTASLD